MLGLHFVHNSPNKICKFRCPPPQRRSALAWFSRKLNFIYQKHERHVYGSQPTKTWRKTKNLGFLSSQLLTCIDLIDGWRINKDIQYIKLFKLSPNDLSFNWGVVGMHMYNQLNTNLTATRKKHMEEVKANDDFSGMGSIENSASLPIIIGFLRVGGDSPNHS